VVYSAEVKRKQSAALAGIQEKPEPLRRSFVRNDPLESDVGNRDVHVAAVAGGTPLGPAERAPYSNPRFPQNLALLVRVKRIRDAGFLADHKLAAAICKRDEIGG
jgi:hypothetical protein